MLSRIFVSAALAALSATVTAQCGTLATNGTGAPGTSLTIDLSGTTPMSFAVVAVGDTLGTTTINLGPNGTLVLGLAQPFVPLPLGQTGIGGSASVTIQVPANIPNGIDLHAQAVVLGITFQQGPPTIGFCATNLVSFHLGL